MMNKKDWFSVIGICFLLSSAVFGSMTWVEGRLDEYVRRDTLEAHMKQVITRLQSIEEALR